MVEVSMKSQLGRLISRKLFLHPIFIVGMGRSGTTILLESLGRHPLIFTASGEAILIYRIGELATILIEGAPKEAYYRGNLRVAPAYLHHFLRRLCFESVFGANYGLKSLVKALVRREVSLSSRKGYWCAKTFPTYDQYRGLVQLYPEAKFIHIVRNGIDVVHSATKHWGENFRLHCEKWTECMERYRYLTEEQSALEVHYEQLVTEPAQFFKKIFNFLDVDNHPDPVDFVTKTLIHPLDKPTQTNVDVQKILSSREPAYLKWSPEQRQIFNEVCGRPMAEKKYEMPF